MYIYKDYQLIADGMLFKAQVSEKNHLLWKMGGVPCLDAYIWDEYYTYRHDIKKVRIQTDKKRIFKCEADIFDQNKQELNLGAGRQYTIEKSLWDIIEYPREQKLEQEDML